MKINLILALLISTFCNAQITLNDMKTILNNDIDYLETFALNRGYVFDKFIDENKLEGIKYSKRNEKNNQLVIYSSYYDTGRKVFSFITSSQKDYLLIKKQLIEQGFKLNNNFNYEGSLCKDYSNKKYILVLCTAKSKDFELSEFYCVNIEYNE
jgi:hypothetical protein